jgi:hypothetical protein
MTPFLIAPAPFLPYGIQIDPALAQVGGVPAFK